MESFFEKIIDMSELSPETNQRKKFKQVITEEKKKQYRNTCYENLKLKSDFKEKQQSIRKSLDKEHCKHMKHLWYLAHKEEVYAKSIKWKEDNEEFMREYQKAYQKAYNKRTKDAL